MELFNYGYCSRYPLALPLPSPKTPAAASKLYNDKIMNCESGCICLFWLAIIKKAQNGTERLHRSDYQRVLHVEILCNTHLHKMCIIHFYTYFSVSPVYFNQQQEVVPCIFSSETLQSVVTVTTAFFASFLMELWVLQN